MSTPPPTLPTPPAMPIAPRLTPPILVAPNGTIKQGTASLLAICFGVFLVVFAVAWAAGCIVVTKAHSTPDDLVIGGCLLGAFICVLPANFQKAATVLEPFVPWHRRAGDRDG